MTDYYKKVGEFEDKYGDKRTIHRVSGSVLRVANTRKTPALALNRAVAPLIGEKIRRLREERGMTLEELCVKAGLASVYPKMRMWEIEKGTRKGHGIRFGTLYAIAHALDVSPNCLLPSAKTVFEQAGVRTVRGAETLAAE